MKFKAGDRVVFIGHHKVNKYSNRSYTNLNRKCGVVLGTHGIDFVRWTVDGDHAPWYCDSDKLEFEKNHIVSSILKDL